MMLGGLALLIQANASNSRDKAALFEQTGRSLRAYLGMGQPKTPKGVIPACSRACGRQRDAAPRRACTGSRSSAAITSPSPAGMAPGPSWSAATRRRCSSTSGAASGCGCRSPRWSGPDPPNPLYAP